MDSAGGRLSAALLLTKNKGRDTIIKKNVKPEGSVPPWKSEGLLHRMPQRNELHPEENQNQPDHPGKGVYF